MIVLAKMVRRPLARHMRHDFDERAVWLVRTVVPHEPALRSWLKLRRIFDLEIDDVVQATYAKLLSLESIEDIRDPKSYAFKTAHSILTSHLRRSRIVSIYAIGDLDRLGVEAPDPSPERQLADRDELRELALAIAAMPAKSRKVFTLRRVDGLDYYEIAGRLRVSKKTVEKRMTVAIRHLMDTFGRGGKIHFQTSNLQDGPLHKKNGTAQHEPGD